MKRSIVVLLYMVAPLLGLAQDSVVKKSLWQVQTGILGLWGSNESRLKNNVVLRSEVGFEGGFQSGMMVGGSVYMAAPVATLAPRWYYNIDRRTQRGRNVSYNSGNFLSFNVMYKPHWFVISNRSDVYAESELMLGPFWGMRRSLGRFSLEGHVGPAYSIVFYKNHGFSSNSYRFLPLWLTLRVGLSFGK